MPGLEDMTSIHAPVANSDNDSLGGDEGLDKISTPTSGVIETPTFTELADGADAASPQVGKQGLDTFDIPTNGQALTSFGDGTAGSNNP
jgi:hypothetical protein